MKKAACVLLYSLFFQLFAQSQTTITKWKDDKKGAVSITYDDGNRNQFKYMLPVMERLQLPATFYIITGPIIGSQYPTKFVGRPVQEIMKETASIPTNANNYLANTDPKVAWPAAGTLQDKIAVIAWQKYFALNGLQANETFTDYRRLGVVQPPLSVAPERGSNPIIRRLLYPTTEYSYNAANVAALGTINQFTTKVFWDK